MRTISGNRIVRHAVATLAYRGAKALRGFPMALRTKRASPRTRTPRELVSHLADLMAWAERTARGEVRWEPGSDSTWRAAEARFFDRLAALDRALAKNRTPDELLQKLVQGPIADALTHVGQLAMLRGIGGARLRPESYARADIAVGKVGRQQARPRFEFDGDASFPVSRTSARASRRLRGADGGGGGRR